MSYPSRAWMIAASVGAVEALKDQMGFCRWNYGLRSLHQHAKKTIRSYTQVQRPSPSLESYSSSSMAMISERMRIDGDEKTKQSEESLRKVMYMSCWGPN
ncbi:uncharacterized protein LOC131220667 [Magnolia sinica]|uniref:uncharacterized protein LOC131220667 n=1 Tax=Magnolia sinica TaxID=86752 RepID=UPI002658E455|nr:uncharacterized protein LOC131220667 [Magnolia sinica]